MPKNEPTTDVAGMAEVRPALHAPSTQATKQDAPPASPPVPPAEDSAAPPPDDGRKTPPEWAVELGHVDGPASVADGDRGKVVRGKIRPIRQAKGWIYAATKAHCGWGKQRPIDVRLTREQYEAAVKEAMGTTLGPALKPHVKGEPTPPATTAAPLAWRHDVAAKAGGES